MPIHLPPLSRRSFLRRSFSAAAGAFVVRSIRADGAANANRWALLSDTHIAADPETVARNVNVAAHLRTALDDVRSRSTQFAGLFINGDCALTEGLVDDYATFSKLLAPAREAGTPIHLALGNHDNRDVFWSSLKDARPANPPLVSRQVSIVEGQDADWFVLDSLDVVNKTPGRLGDEQRAWLAKALDARAGKNALVMVHHNPIDPSSGKATGLLDTRELLEILLPRKHVKALFFGHTHTWRLTEKDGMHLVNLPAVAYPFSPNEITGWVDMTVRENGAALEVRSNRGEHPAHGAVRELKWRAS